MEHIEFYEHFGTLWGTLEHVLNILKHFGTSMDLYEAVWAIWAQDGSVWAHMGPPWTIQTHLGPITLWAHMGP